MMEIIDYSIDGQEVKHQDAFITRRTGTKRRRETTKGWEILIEWKDGSTNWVGCQGIISSSAGRVCHLQPHSRGTSICLVGTICDEEEKSHPGKSQVQGLAKVTQLRDQDPQVCRGGKESRQPEWKYSLVGCNLQRNAQRATSF